MYSSNSLRYSVGGNSWASDLYKNLTNSVSVKNISDSITFRLRNVHTQDSPIKISNKKIISMIGDIIDTYRPSNIGGIYTREIQRVKSVGQEIQERETEISEIVINSMVNTIKNEYDTTEKNKKFSKMNTVYGDFNEAGLQAYSNSMIKLNNKNDNKTALFNMRY